jgi:dienelactone hydrolase
MLQAFLAIFGSLLLTFPTSSLAEPRAELLFDAFSQAPPTAPADAAHPGSAAYRYTVFQEQFQVQGRQIDFFAPAEIARESKKAPVIVFGHGQALETQHYRLMFEHLAKKGYAVIVPKYDTGFFDRNWRRMANDYADLASAAMSRHAKYIDPNLVIYSGHSKGAYVALVSAGIPRSSRKVEPKAMVLFAPAGYDSEYIRNVTTSIPVTIVHGEKDTIIASSLIQEIYSALPSSHKQLIEPLSYKTQPELPADHYIVMTKSFFMGGRDGISPFHYYGAFKWLIGAADDLVNGGPLTNPYVYGDLSIATGIEGFRHRQSRSW